MARKGKKTRRNAPKKKAACRHIIKHARTAAERKAAAERLRYARSVGDSHGTMLAVAMLGPCENPKKVKKNRVLTSRARRKLSPFAYGLPKQRKYPMPDRVHAINAKGRAKQQLKAGRLTKSQYQQIVRKADRIIYGAKVPKAVKAREKVAANPKRKKTAEVKRLLQSAKSKIKARRFAEADRLVRKAVTRGMTMGDIQNALSANESRAMNDWFSKR